MAIQEQYVLVKKANGDVGITQNSIEAFSSINSGAVVNTLVLKEGMVGIGTDSPSAKLHVQVANTINKQALLIEQLDTTNNPICAEINNDGTNHGLYLHQDGELAANKIGLYVHSTVAQVNNGILCQIYQAHASSTSIVFSVANQGTGQGVHIAQTGNGIAQEIDNNGTNHALYIHQDGVLTSGKHALYVHSTAAQINSPLVYFYSNVAGSTQPVLKVNQRHASSSGYAIQTYQYGTGIGIHLAMNLATSASSGILVEQKGTGHGIYIDQSGVLASGKSALYIYSNAVQVNSELMDIRQNNSSSTAIVARIDNGGKGTTLQVISAGVLSNTALNANLLVYSNAIQVNKPQLHVVLDNVSSTANVVEIENDGTGHCLYIHQDGVLASSKFGLYVHSTAAQTTSELIYIYNQNASSTRATMYVQNQGSGDTINIDSNGTGNGLYISADGVLTSGKYALYVYSNAVQVNSPLMFLEQDNASSTADVLEIQNDGTGHGIYLHQDGVLASEKYGLYIYSNADQLNSHLVFIEQDAVGSTADVVVIQNDGTGHALDIQQVGINAGSHYGLRVLSNSNQVNAPLVFLKQDASGSTANVLQTQNDGTGTGIQFNQYGDGIAQEIDNNGTNHALYIHQDGVLTSGKHALYVYSNAVQVNSPLVFFEQDHASSDQDVLVLQQDGTGYALNITVGQIKLPNGTGINEFSIDGTLAGDSDDAVPTEKAVKAYVDANAGSAFGSWTSATVGSSTLATTDGIIIIYCSSTNATGNYYRVKTNSSNPPTVIRGGIPLPPLVGDSTTVPVKKDEYYLIETDGNAANITAYWIPLS